MSLLRMSGGQSQIARNLRRGHLIGAVSSGRKSRIHDDDHIQNTALCRDKRRRADNEGDDGNHEARDRPGLIALVMVTSSTF